MLQIELPDSQDGRYSNIALPGVLPIQIYYTLYWILLLFVIVTK